MAAGSGHGALGRRIVFMGSPEFALPSLQALFADGWQVPLVLSQPDRPAGRGRGSTPTAVSAWAREHGLELATPEDLEDPVLLQRLEALGVDWFVVVAYRLLPDRLLALPRSGCVNLHASLLPDFRGAAPIQRALLAGCHTSGLSTFRLEPGMDTGPLLLQQELDIGENENAGSLHDRMSVAGADLLRLTMAGLADGSLQARPQVLRPGLRRAPKLGPRTRRLVFGRPAEALHNRIRALAPAPGAVCRFRGRLLQLLESRVDNGPVLPARPGTLQVEHNRLLVSCAEGRLEILRLKPEGRGPMAAGDWLNGTRPEPGECFETMD